MSDHMFGHIVSHCLTVGQILRTSLPATESRCLHVIRTVGYNTRYSLALHSRLDLMAGIVDQSIVHESDSDGHSIHNWRPVVRLPHTRTILPRKV